MPTYKALITLQSYMNIYSNWLTHPPPLTHTFLHLYSLTFTLVPYMWASMMFLPYMWATMTFWPQLFKRWITRFIQWITQLVSLIRIHWIAICPVDSVIHLLNNWGLALIIHLVQPSAQAFSSRSLYSVTSRNFAPSRASEKRRPEY